MTAPAEHLVALASALNAAAVVQADHQRDVGFGQEGDELRRALDLVDRTAPLGFIDAARAEAQRNLRNYYVAKLALIDTEVSEAIEEIRNGRSIDERYESWPTLPAVFVTKHDGDIEAALEEHHATTAGKPEGVPSELADVIIRVLSLAGEVGIPIGDVVAEKIRYNETRAQRHGGKAI